MNPERPWYKKKRFVIPALVLAGLIAFGNGNDGKTAVQSSQAVAPAVQKIAVPEPAPAKAMVPNPALSNTDFYTNVDGNRVQRPTYYSSIPAGASAQCGDGTYSFSQHRQGTCSHHGGVEEWL